MDRETFHALLETLQRTAVAIGATFGLWLLVIWGMTALARWLF